MLNQNGEENCLSKKRGQACSSNRWVWRWRVRDCATEKIKRKVTCTQSQNSYCFGPSPSWCEAGCKGCPSSSKFLKKEVKFSQRTSGHSRLIHHPQLHHELTTRKAVRPPPTGAPSPPFLLSEWKQPRLCLREGPSPRLQRRNPRLVNPMHRQSNRVWQT